MCDVVELVRVISEQRCVEAEDEFEKARMNSSERQKVQLSAYDDDEKIESSFIIRRTPDQKYSLLLWRDSEREVVLDVQGFISQSMLPPLTSRHSSWRNPLSLKQNTTLLGTTAKFSSACAALERLYRHFEQSFGKDQLKKWALPSVGSTDSAMPAIMSATRFVSPTSDLHLWPSALPLLTDAMDVDGVVKTWVGEGRMAFTDDNYVRYTEMKFDNGHLHRTITDPSYFRAGHLVEMGLSVRAVENRSHGPVQHSFLVHLDSLFLHNRLVSKILSDNAALRTSLASHQASVLPKTTQSMPKKRRVEEGDMYDFQNVTVTNKLSHLSISSVDDSKEKHEHVSEAMAKSVENIGTD
ncbi:hypothetical protein BJ138DRAFT_1120010 [Hygrophoropsis aurantiaca]|uniref:Uncharacterized protein n=1 Tax=Hygrophoropsis aurantiaca TaxID=72124 RepID=A0ACB7ZT16_9AGAM|nr:hypothetical protein BJ138DRAFT_1120010 [Hygrophoropsis aurantiaca]